jgi:type I restriction enzyme S subunit
LKVVRDHARLFFTGATGHQRVDEAFFSNLTVPCPAVEVQSEITAELEDMRWNARRIIREANEALARAKLQIESMLIGRNAD